jgi:1-phosphatidylinositol phosphodiesterase
MGIDTPGNRWITELSDSNKSRSVSTLSIPGTHDSGTKGIPTSIGGGITQNTTISQQLEMGVRFLDIRLKPNGSELKVYHGPLPANLSFDDVLKACRSFLRKNPKEFILMSVKGEGVKTTQGSDFSNIFSTNYQKDLETSNGVPTIEGAEGKIILLRRFDFPKVGIALDIPDDTPNSGDIGKDGNHIFVQDKYKFKLSQADDKKEVIKEFLDKTGTVSVHVNFTSATGTDAIFGIFPQPESMANKINPWIIGELASKTVAVGTIATDFIQEELAYSIYIINKHI